MTFLLAVAALLAQQDSPTYMLRYAVGGTS